MCYCSFLSTWNFTLKCNYKVGKLFRREIIVFCHILLYNYSADKMLERVGEKMKKGIVLLIICAFSIVFTGCGNENENVKNIAQKNADSFSSGDMDEINELMFGTNELNIDIETGEVEDSENDYQGILRKIFSHSTVVVKKVEKDMVEFVITAPNMENVFEKLPDNSEDFKEDDLLKYIDNFVDNVEMKEFTISVPYVVDGENVVINYHDENFVNAITGGLLDAYRELYISALAEYQKGVD